VGPGGYTRAYDAAISNLRDSPKVSMTLTKRFRSIEPAAKNQTFDTRQSMGIQISSKHKTNGTGSFYRASREYKTCQIKDPYVKKPCNVRIKIPKF